MGGVCEGDGEGWGEMKGEGEVMCAWMEGEFLELG